jgi:tetratricopeptide (TPR) repeat protein
LSFLIQKRYASWNLSELGEALADYALTLRPDSADAHLLKAWYASNRGDAESAIKEGKEALSHDGENARAWLALGYFLASADRVEEAITAFRQTLELHPGIEQKPIILQMIASLEHDEPKVKIEHVPRDDKMADRHGQQQTGSAINPS